MSDNVYFMESELCMGTMNDKCVDKLHKKREPKHWNSKHSTTQSVVVARKGVCHTGLESRSRARPQSTSHMTCACACAPCIQAGLLLTRLSLALHR